MFSYIYLIYFYSTLTTNCCWKNFSCFGKKRQHLIFYCLKTWQIEEYYPEIFNNSFKGKHNAQHTGSFHWYISWAPSSFPPLITENVSIKNHPQVNNLSEKVNTTKALASLVRIRGSPWEAPLFKQQSLHLSEAERGKKDILKSEILKWTSY